VLDAAEEMSKGFVPLFLTLTLRNCRAETVELSKTLDAVFNGWYRFTHHRKIRNTLAGWFRSLELTYNEETDTFHPHIHILLFVDKSYFKAGCYMETTEWVRLWRVSLRLDYDPICDIRRVKNSEERRTEIAEVAKYTVKDTEIFTHKKARTDRLVSVLSVSLKGRRLYAFGGLLKRVRADILAADPDERDGTIRGDIATVIERYKWVFGISNYMRVDLLETTENQAEKLCLSDATER
jgi:hypothetical protein